MLADLDRFMIHGIQGHSFIHSKSILRVYYVIYSIVNAGDTDRKGCYSTEAYILMM